MMIKRFWMVILALILAVSLGLTVSAATVPAAAAKAMNRYIVTLTGEDLVARGRIHALVHIQQGKILHEYQIIPALAVVLPETAAAALARDPAVLRIEPDAVAHIATTELENSWGVDHIDADLTWSADTGAGVTGAGIDVAVIDTGIDATHPDLAGSVITGRSFLNNGSVSDSYDDDNGHGTHVAGTIGARADNNGVVGVAPAVNFYIAKVLDSSGSGYYSDIIAGINWAAGQGVDVINMSLGGTADIQALEDAVIAAYQDEDIVVVAAAGNAGGNVRKDTVIYPAKYASVIAVAATDSSDIRASFSSTGPAVELSAPGVGILSTIPGGGYASWSGTSMASPHVAGTAALLKAADPTATASEIRAMLQQMADDLGTAGRDVLYGYGLVDAHIGSGTVEPPPPDPEPEVFATTTSVVAGDGSFIVGEKVPIMVTVTKEDGTTPVSGATVTVSVTAPNNKSKTLTGTTNADGQAVVTYSTNKTNPVGTYDVLATTADSTLYTGSTGTCTFVLSK